jgi:hypothetical protein
LGVNYKIRKAKRKELDLAIEWAAKEGWNPGLHDADVFWKTDPKGYVALEKDGGVIGSGSIVSYDSKFGFMGFFIIKPEFRGQGLGTKLWFWRKNKLLSRLNKGAAIGMDGVFNMQPFYSKGGFVFSHRDLRMESIAKADSYSDKVQKITSKDFETINKYDKKCFGIDRKTFLKGWLNLKDSISYKYIDGSEIKGYGVIRKCQKGYKIGPLFAENYEVAHELFKALSSYVPGEVIYLDIPELNKDAVKLAKIYGMKEMFGCARMYHGKAPKLPYDKIFGITTFELG